MDKNFFSVIGGDARQFYLAEYAASRGNKVLIFGFDKFNLSPKSAHLAGSLSEAISAPVIILPLPLLSNDGHIFAPFYNKALYLDELFSFNLSGKIIFGGKISDDFKSRAAAQGARVIDYLNLEELAILNAVSTAEGAIASAVTDTVSTIFESNCLVTGYGRIGKILSNYLKMLGAGVFVSARKESDLAYIRANGMTALKTDSLIPYLHRFDIIFNTVPYIIFKKAELEKLKRDAVMIELASSPYGIDFDYADELGIKTIIKGGLPGKTAPKKSGEIIWNTIEKQLKGG